MVARDLQTLASHEAQDAFARDAIGTGRPAHIFGLERRAPARAEMRRLVTRARHVARATCLAVLGRLVTAAHAGRVIAHASALAGNSERSIV